MGGRVLSKQSAFTFRRADIFQRGPDLLVTSLFSALVTLSQGARLDDPNATAFPGICEPLLFRPSYRGTWDIPIR
jgi:hypothetical protein